MEAPLVSFPGTMKKYQAILFDMDGVIVDSMPLHAWAWIEVIREYGVHLTVDDIYMREGMSGLESIADIFKEKRFPVPSTEELKALQEKKLQLFENHRIDVFPVAVRILKLLSGKKIPLGLVTGSLRRSVDHVLPEEVESFFKVIVTVEDIHRGKPDPEPYLRAVEKIGCAAHETLAIENAPMGILSAKNAGLDCFAVETTLAKPYLQNADIVFQDHTSLLEFFEKALL